MVLNDLLAAEGALITCVDNGALAVEQVRAGQAFDVMLCDIEMPVMDGYEATRQIKAMAPGMVDYLTKPYMIDQLVKHIAKHALQPAAITPKQRSAPAVGFGIDRQALINHYPQGEQFIDRLFATIRDTSHDLPRQLREAAARQDAVQLRELAHNTKGMAANLLVNDLRWLASHIEALCRTQPEAALSAADSLASAVEAMISSLGLD